MGRRLVLGPILILLVIATMWGDQAIESVGAPAWLAWLALPTGFFAPGLVLLPVGCLVAGRAAIELARLYRASGMAASRRVVVFAAIIGVITGGLTIGAPHRAMGGVQGGAPLATAAALVLACALLVHVRNKDLKGACGAAGAALMAFVYAGVILGFIMAIRTEFSAWVVLAVILTAKSCDTGAYFTGTLIGKHKMIPWISPGKTWEGLVGGLLTSGAAGMLCVWMVDRWGTPTSLLGLGMPMGFVGGVVLGAAAQLGDLSASILKRDAGVKDSGRLIPGMGGILDVIDSLVLAGPAGYWFLMAVR